jgi:hypothetical protein
MCSSRLKLSLPERIWLHWFDRFSDAELQQAWERTDG